jgi:hypothetical protein
VIAFAGAYLLWRLVRRLLPLVLIAAVVIVLLAPNRQLPAAERQLRRDVQAEVHTLQQKVASALKELHQ